MDNLTIIDGHGWLYRAHYGNPNDSAFNTFTGMLRDYTEKYQPSHLVVALDATRESWRSEMFPAYKANRKENPPELTHQLNHFAEFLNIAMIPHVGLAGFEADDIAGTLCKKFSDTCRIYLATGDKDWAQLVTEQVTMIRPKPYADGKAQFELFGVSGVMAKFGVLPEYIVEVLALQGDTTDGIPGVAGIGEKIATQLIQGWLTLDWLYENLHDVERKMKSGSRIRGLLKVGKEAAFISRALATINCDAPLNVEMEDLKWNSAIQNTGDK